MEEVGSKCENFPAPGAPPLPGLRKTMLRRQSRSVLVRMQMWERLFDEGYRTDVSIHTCDDHVIHAHACVLGMASPVMKSMLKQSRRHGRQRSIYVQGVPYQAVRVFIRYFYSSRRNKKGGEKLRRERYIYNYMRPWKHLFIYVGMDVEQLAPTTRY